MRIKPKAGRVKPAAGKRVKPQQSLPYPYTPRGKLMQPADSLLVRAVRCEKWKDAKALIVEALDLTDLTYADRACFNPKVWPMLIDHARAATIERWLREECMHLIPYHKATVDDWYPT